LVAQWWGARAPAAAGRRGSLQLARSPRRPAGRAERRAAGRGSPHRVARTAALSI